MKNSKTLRGFASQNLFFCSQKEFAAIFHSKLTGSAVADGGAVLAVYNPDRILNLMSKFTVHRSVDSCRCRLNIWPDISTEKFLLDDSTTHLTFFVFEFNKE